MVQASPSRAQARRVKDLTEVTVEDLWKEVKDEDGWWGEIGERSRRTRWGWCGGC